MHTFSSSSNERHLIFIVNSQIEILNIYSKFSNRRFFIFILNPEIEILNIEILNIVIFYSKL